MDFLKKITALLFIFLALQTKAFSQDSTTSMHSLSGIGIGLNIFKPLALYDVGAIAVGVKYRNKNWKIIPEVYFSHYFSNKYYSSVKGWRLNPSVYIPLSTFSDPTKGYFFTGVGTEAKDLAFTAHTDGYAENDNKKYLIYMKKHAYSISAIGGLHFNTKINLFIDLQLHFGVRYIQNYLSLLNAPEKDLINVTGDSMFLGYFLNTHDFWSVNFQLRLKIGYFIPFH